MEDPAELVRVGVDVDQGLAGMVGRDERISVGGGLPQPGPDRDDQVGIAHALLQLRVGAVAELTGIDLAAVADRVLPAEGGGDGDAVAEGEVGEMVRGARAPVGAANDRDRRRGVLQELEQGLDRAWIGRFGDGRNTRPVISADLIAEHVLRQRQNHRAGAAGGGDAIGSRDIFGNAASVLDPRRPFGNRRKERRKVDLLEALAVAVAARDVADEKDHRS